SFALQSLVSLNIHNQCKTIKLTSPIYFIHGGKWHVAPDQKIHANAVVSNRIEFDAKQDILEGTLVYKIQRKHVASARDESKHNWFLIAWHSEHIRELHVRSLVIEYNKRLDEDRLKKMYQ